MRRRYVTNRAARASLTRSKYIIVACCAAIAMILGAMSVGASRSGASPDEETPVMLNENTSYNGIGSSGTSSNAPTSDNSLAGLQLLPANTSKPYTAPASKNTPKSAKLNVLLGANPIRLNIAAEGTGKGLQIDLDVTGVDTGPVQVTVPDIPPVDTSTITDPITTPPDTTATEQNSGDSGSDTGNSQSTDVQLLSTTVQDSDL